MLVIVWLEGRLISLHIAVSFEQVVIFKSAPFSVALGAYVPSHESIRCRLYHCLIPSFFDNLSATSLMMPLRSPSIVFVILCFMPLRREPTEVAVGLAVEEVVVVAALSMRLWPRVEVLS